MGFKTKNGVLLKYEETGTLERLGIRKKGETLAVPKTVTEIGDEAFTMTDISSLSIPSSVLTIGEKAFALCADLENIELSAGLRQIGPNAFDGCHLLRGITLPSTCQSVGMFSFCNCSGLKEVKLSSNLETIERGTFSGCSHLTAIAIPEAVQHIDTRAFFGCSALESIKLVTGLRTIGREAFAGCTALTQIYIPETVTEIAEDAFANCTELKTIVIPPSVTRLHPFAFGTKHNLKVITTTTGSAAHQFAQEHGIMCYTEKEASLLRGCNPAFYIEYGILRKYTQEYNVRDLMIPEGVIRIGNHAFERNKQLVTVVIPEGVVEIGGYAFNGCRNLQRIYLPSTLKRIGRFAFRDCPLVEVILPQGIEVIEKNAFQSCTTMRRFYMPDTVTRIGNEALRDCMSLTELRFSASVESIPDGVCTGCSSMRTVVIPEGPKYIQQNAFRNCSSLREAYIPDSILELSGNAFADTPLFRMTAGHYIVGRFLIRADGYSPIPKGVRRIGPRAFERGGLRAAIIPDGVISIGDNAFANCGVLTDVVIPTSVVEIGVDAFAYTPWLSRRAEPYTIAGANILLHANIQQPEVDVPLGVRCIAPAAFAQLPMRRVRLPEGVTHIQHGAFSYCDQLEEIMLPSTLRRIDGYIFHSCTSLSKVDFREGPTKIGHAMFSSCTSLKTVRLPSTLTEIENEAFYHAGIEKLIIPDGVTRIGMSAFSHCEHLQDIAIPPSVTQIDENAFAECPKFRIHGQAGSFAERYARQHQGLITFVSLAMDETPVLDEPIKRSVAPPVPKRKPIPRPQRSDPDFLFQTNKAEPSVERKQAAAKDTHRRQEIIFIEPQSTQTSKQTDPPVTETKSTSHAAQSRLNATEPIPSLPSEEEIAAILPDVPIMEELPATSEKQTSAASPVAKPAQRESSEEPKKEAPASVSEASPPAKSPRMLTPTFDAEEEQNYAARVKRELEAARKKSVPINPDATLPPLPVEPETTLASKKAKRPKREKAAKEESKTRRKPSLLDDLPDLPEEREKQEMRLRAKETPEETKARHRASLLDDLPDLPEDRARKQRTAGAPDEQRARRRASLLDDLPELPDERESKSRQKTQEGIGETSVPAKSGADIPKIDANMDDHATSNADDPFADIHWNDDQTTFTIRL